MTTKTNPPLLRPRWQSLTLHGTISGVLVAVLWLALADEVATQSALPWLAWGTVAGLVAGVLAAFQALALMRETCAWPRRCVAWCVAALLGGIVFGAAAFAVMGAGVLLAAALAGVWSLSWLFLKFPLTS